MVFSSELTKIKILSADFDRTTQNLKRCVDGDFSVIGSGLDASESLSKLADAVERVDNEVRNLKANFNSSESVSLLKLRLEAAFKRVEPVFEEQPSTPPSMKYSSQSSVDADISSADMIDDFPTTPTLEQLGLSGPTLSIVGARRIDFEASASMSDTEFDNSFYQKSPMASRAVDNSFSSDVSIPQFKMFNSGTESSPSSSNILPSATPRTQAKSHLKKVTNASAGGTDEDEEFASKSLAKRVHFMEDSENKMANQ